MFRWYRNAKFCYVYLSDLVHVGWHESGGDDDDAAIRQQLSKCRWFTRGWTLQELLAPQHVQFYASNWREVGNKHGLCRVISAITGIDEDILLGGNLGSVSVARRMSWASDRKTSRIEDMAYCLLGIFDISIPLIYGEGPKAFRRLQEAIMTSTYDQSLFAWGRFVDFPPSDTFKAELDTWLNLDVTMWKPADQRPHRLGLFAESPSDFRACRDIRPVDHQYTHALYRERAPSIVSGGVFISMVIWARIPSVSYLDDPKIAYRDDTDLAFLLCRVGGGTGVNGGKLVSLVLRPCGNEYYSRTDELMLIDEVVSFDRFQAWTHPRHFLPWPEFRLCHGDIFLRRWVSEFKDLEDWRAIIASGPSWRRYCSNKVLRPQEGAKGNEYFCNVHQVSQSCHVGITLKRALTGLAHSFSSSSSSSSSSFSSYLHQPLGTLLVGASIIGRAPTSSGQGNSYKPRAGMNGYGTGFGSGGAGGDHRYRESPQYSHVMALPSDTWELEKDHLPRIYFKFQRMTLAGGNGGEVDVVDLFMLKAGPHAERVKKALPNI